MENEEGREYSIGELAEEAGVSTRTIRYYVSEGLLPPPAGSGPHSRYTEAHRERLETIGRLKAQYLPLKEIRRRLVGLGPDALPSAAPMRRNHNRLAQPGEHLQSRVFAERSLASPAFREQAESYGRHEDALAMARPRSASPERDQPWRRVTISEEAELLITEDQYRRHQDKIDWLIQWARRVLRP